MADPDFAERLGEDKQEWGLAGLLHDIDVELTEGDMNSHGRLGADLIREMGESEELVHAILAHNEAHGAPLGEAEVRLTKEFLGRPIDEVFCVPDQVYEESEVS